MMEYIELCTEAQALFDHARVDDFFALEGRPVKQAHNRRVLYLQRGGHGVYLKLHHGSGWREILKNFLYLRLPVVSARNEWRAIERFHQLGVPTARALGYGEQGRNPARRRSFLLTAALEQTLDLETLFTRLRAEPAAAGIRYKRRLLARAARALRVLHAGGVNHRDFYLCHLRAAAVPRDPPRLYVMDLHRVQQRRRTPARWRIKDLAALLYSALYAPGGPLCNRGDCLRFIQDYFDRPWPVAVAQQRRLLRRVLARARRMARHDRRPAAPLAALETARHSWQRPRAAARSRGPWRVVCGPGVDPVLGNRLFDAESFFQQPLQWLKRERGNAVALVAHGRRRLVIKRYRPRHPGKALLDRLRGSRAARAWDSAHQLRAAGVPVAKPLAYVEQRYGPLCTRAYYVSEYVAGRRCREFFADASVADDQRVAAMDGLARLFDRLRAARIAHGDAKDTNIVLRRLRPVLLDLDAVRRHRLPWLRRRAQARDLRRLLRNWRAQPALQALFRARFAALEGKRDPAA